MKCKKCNEELPKGSKSCPKCGDRKLDYRGLFKRLVMVGLFITIIYVSPPFLIRSVRMNMIKDKLSSFGADISKISLKSQNKFGSLIIEEKTGLMAYEFSKFGIEPTMQFYTPTPIPIPTIKLTYKVPLTPAPNATLHTPLPTNESETLLFLISEALQQSTDFSKKVLYEQYSDQNWICKEGCEGNPSWLSSMCMYGCTEPRDGCNVKANISFDTKEKIFHVPGQEFYDQVVINPKYGERWFCYEEEAIANGWRKADH